MTHQKVRPDFPTAGDSFVAHFRPSPLNDYSRDCQTGKEKPVPRSVALANRSLFVPTPKSQIKKNARLFCEKAGQKDIPHERYRPRRGSAQA